MRKAWVLGRVIAHLLYGFIVALLLWPLLGKALKQRIEKRWARQLLGFAGEIEVLAPPALRERMAQQAGAVLALYALR